jgi:hypothetical protein
MYKTIVEQHQAMLEKPEEYIGHAKEILKAMGV